MGHNFCLVFFFSFVAILGPPGLIFIIVQHFPKKCGNAAMPQSGKNNVKPLVYYIHCKPPNPD